MDNIVFIPSTRETEWVGELLPGTSPAELPVVGRRVIDYAIERAQKFDVMFTEILDWNFSERLADDFADMTKTGVPVFYMKGEGPMPKGLRDLEGYSSPLTSNMTDGLVVVWGLALSMHTADEISLEPVSEEDCAKTPAGRWLEADELGAPAVFLASHASDAVNGQILYVDGGILAYIGRQPK